MSEPQTGFSIGNKIVLPTPDRAPGRIRSYFIGLLLQLVRNLDKRSAARKPQRSEQEWPDVIGSGGNAPSQRSEQQEWTPLSLAQHFHNIYERCAPEFGYETRAETRDFNPETPNGKLMIAVCSEILRDFNAALAAEREKWMELCDKTSSNATKSEQQLAAERERTKAVIEATIEMYEKLLAAERQLVEWCEVHVPTKDEPIKCCPCCEAVAERQRANDATDLLTSETKRLSEAVAAERTRDYFPDDTIVAEAIDDAVAKVKEPPPKHVLD